MLGIRSIQRDVFCCCGKAVAIFSGFLKDISRSKSMFFLIYKALYPKF